MEKINNFFKQNEATISFLRWVVFPIAIAACFFALDGRYVQKGDWASAMAEQRVMTQTLSLDQKASFNKLTDAITVLATEQRNAAELQRNNATVLGSIVVRIDKHENTDYARWEKLDTNLKELDRRIDTLETNTGKFEYLIRGPKG